MLDEQHMTCPDCGAELQLGDWPFCEGKNNHGSIWGSHAQRFSPIVVHQNADGSYYWPGSTDEPVKAGRRKIEIRDIREADRVCREENARQDAALRSVQAQSDTSRSLTRQRNRDFMNSIRHKLSPAGREFLDRAREYQAMKDKERGNSKPRSTNFHFDVFAHDSSNREQHSDERTGWRSKKA
jgi:hypothetical protein